MKRLFKENHLLAGIIAGVILGGLVGSLFPETGVSLGFLGTLFLNALKMIVIPLIIVSITLSIMSMENFGRLGLKTIAYFAVTTGIAVTIGIFVVNIVHPGAGTAVLSGEMPEMVKSKESMSIIDILVEEFVSPNLFNSAADFDILPLIIASILFGAAFASLGTDKKPLVEIFSLLDRADRDRGRGEPGLSPRDGAREVYLLRCARAVHSRRHSPAADPVPVHEAKPAQVRVEDGQGSFDGFLYGVLFGDAAA